MTLARLLALASFAGLAACAALPLGGDDLIECPDGGCTVPSNDASVDAIFSPPDGAADGAPEPLRRSSLCGTTCSPDDPTACSVSVMDGGAMSSVDAAGLACRVVSSDDAMCVASGNHTDGEACMSGADCAPGYECVGDPGICRHYCCTESSCSAFSAANKYSPYYFCDVAVEKTSNVSVPVCMEQVSCDSFFETDAASGCPYGQACTIVEAYGMSSEQVLIPTCDTIGKAKAGESCETEQCEKGFACYGLIGDRTCQQLCDGTVNNPCQYPATCANIGIAGAGICTSN